MYSYVQAVLAHAHCFQTSLRASAIPGLPVADVNVHPPSGPHPDRHPVYNLLRHAAYNDNDDTQTV